jgi:hypothetical protein
VSFIESSPCSGPSCSAMGCNMTAWTEWGACSTPCGGGTRIRTRQYRTDPAPGAVCGPFVQTELCNTKSC